MMTTVTEIIAAARRELQTAAAEMDRLYPALDVSRMLEDHPQPGQHILEARAELAVALGSLDRAVEQIGLDEFRTEPDPDDHDPQRQQGDYERHMSRPQL